MSLDNNSNGRSFLPTNSWRALKQRLLRTPELALVSLAGTRCSNSQIPVFRLSINPELNSKFSQLTSCSRPSYCRFSLNTPSLLFPFSPMNFLNSIPLEWFFSSKYLSSLISIHWVLLKDCLSLFGLVVIY